MEFSEPTDKIKGCYWYLSSPFSAYFLSVNMKDNFRCSLNDMTLCIESLTKDEPIVDFKYINIEKGLNDLIDLQREIINDEKFSTFVKNYIYLAYSVNKNTLNNSLIDDKCLQILRYIENNLTFSETLLLFKSVSNNLNRWKEYVPPAFRLSEHYYKIIREE